MLMKKRKKVCMVSFLFEFIFVLFLMLCTRNTIDYTIRFVILYLMIQMMFGHYRASTMLIWEEIELLIKSHLCIYCASLLLISTEEDTIYLLLMNLVIVFLSFLYDVLVNRAIRIMMRKWVKENVLIIGTGKEAVQLAHVCRTNRFSMMDVVGFVDYHLKKPSPIAEIEEEYQIYAFDSMCKVIENQQIDTVIIAIPDIEKKQMNEFNHLLFNKVEKIKYLPRASGFVSFDTKVQDFDGLLVVSTSLGKQGIGSLFCKRVIDIIGGLAGCLILLPLIWLVRRKNRSTNDYDPIFFPQERIGKNGKPFKIYKFRTMVPDAEKVLDELMELNPKIREEYETNKKLRDDPRITAAGKLLREKSLDEFPQFINVVKGEMSLVGPRPYLPREIKDMDVYYNSVIGCLPGVTGMWQSHGRSDVSFTDRLQMDDYYYRNWSIWLDITILIKTIKMVFKGEGAL